MLAWGQTGGPPASGRVNSSRALLELGFSSTPQGLAEAVATGNPPTVIAALNAAADLKSDALKGKAMGLLRSKNYAIQLAAGKYLGAIGEPAGAQVVRNFGEAPREYLLDDRNLQLLVIDAAREVARNGHVDYAFQLPLLIEQGDWEVKTFAALALRDFRKFDDAMVENAWLRVFGVYRDAIALDDANVRRDAVLFMRTALESARALDAISEKVRDEFIKLAAEGPPVHVPDASTLDFAGIAAHVRGLEVKNPRDEAPTLDPDPCFVGQSAAERLLSIIDKGPFETLAADLDDRGTFEGLSKAEWTDKLIREHSVPLDGVDKRILTRSVRTSRPTSYEVRVEIQGDQYDQNTGKWTAMVYRMTVTWWGYGWHFSSFERFRNPRQPPDLDSLPTPQLDERHPEAQEAALQLVRALSEMDLAALESSLADDVRIRGGQTTKAQFLEEMGALFNQTRGQIVFRPVSYSFKPAEAPGTVAAEIELRSYNRAQHRQAKVMYSLEISAHGDRWLIDRLDAQTTKIEF